MEEIIREAAPEQPEEAKEAETEQTDEEAEETQKTKKELKKSDKLVRKYEFFFLRVLILIAILWVLFFKIIGLTHMPTDDMYPRFSAGDMLLFYRLNTKNVRAQDVIVIEKTAPDSTEPDIYVCRVVAVAGDTVEITDNESLIVNGNTMIEPNIFYRTPRYEGFVNYPITLREGEVFVLSDKREGGEDSRYFGPVKIDEIVGTVITVARRNNL